MTMTATRIYYLVTVEPRVEVLRRCEATSRKQAMRRLGVDGGNLHLYDVVTRSGIDAETRDPRGLVR